MEQKWRRTGWRGQREGGGGVWEEREEEGRTVVRIRKEGGREGRRKKEPQGCE